jgi:hypothetical protein
LSNAVPYGRHFVFQRLTAGTKLGSAADCTFQQLPDLPRFIAVPGGLTENKKRTARALLSAPQVHYRQTENRLVE